MKIIFFSLAFFYIGKSFAIPVLNETFPNKEGLTLYPDHEKKGVLYALPYTVQIAQDIYGRPFFHYRESRKRFKKTAILQTILKLKFHEYPFNYRSLNLNKEVVSIAPINFFDTRTKFSLALENTISSKSCDNIISSSQSYVVCELFLTSKGIKVYKRMMKGEISFVVHVNFKTRGYVRNPDNTFDAEERKFGISGWLTPEIPPDNLGVGILEFLRGDL